MTTPQIDDAFIAKWEPLYDTIPPFDQGDYERLVKQVAQDMASLGTISKNTFLGIWKWKGPNARRATGKLELYRYEPRYTSAFQRAAAARPTDKLSVLLAAVPPDTKLPGIGAPIGTTYLHFMHPETMPIMDSRAAECFWSMGLISTKNTYPSHYNQFRRAMDSLRSRCPNWTLRQIDRALMAYHILEFDNGKRASAAANPLPMTRATVDALAAKIAELERQLREAETAKAPPTPPAEKANPETGKVEPI
jgi:hypothetical protein